MLFNLSENINIFASSKQDTISLLTIEAKYIGCLGGAAKDRLDPLVSPGILLNYEDNDSNFDLEYF